MTWKKKSDGDWRLYLIIDLALTGKRPVREIARRAAAGGVKMMQLRGKEATSRQLLEAGRGLRDFTRQRGIVFIVNDRADVARAIDADGVHLGPDDLPVKAARKILGRGKIVGVSCRNVARIREAEREGADYLAVGPVFATPVKAGTPPAGLKLVRQAAKTARIPWLAVGGIDENNVAAVRAAGAERIAVIRAVLQARDVTRACRRLNELLAGGVPPAGGKKK